MPGQVGVLELLVVLVIALIVLGPKRLPEMARNLGRGVREFREAISMESTAGDDDEDDDEPEGDRDPERDREASLP